MSRSNPDEFLRNPSRKYIKFAGGEEDGTFSYYDKDLQKDILIPLEEFKFLILDHRLFCITGYSDPIKAYCYSNEVRTIKDKLVIRNFANKAHGTVAGTLLEGTYEELKGEEGPLKTKVKTRQLKYTRSVYIWFQGEICNLHITGKTMQLWLENIERSQQKMISHWVKLSKIHDGKNGTVDFKYAEFEFGDKVSPEDDAEAVEADKILQDYLKKYFAKNGTADNADGAHDPSNEETQERDFNPSNWRQFDMNGFKMGELNLSMLRDYKIAAEEGGLDNDYTECLNAAVREYEVAGKTWEQATDQTGKSLSSYSVKELEALAEKLQKQAPMHKSRLKVEFALETMNLKAKASGPVFDDDDDDIPF